MTDYFWDLIPKFVLGKKANLFFNVALIVIPVCVSLIMIAILKRHVLTQPGVPHLTVMGKYYRHEVILYRPISNKVLSGIRQKFNNGLKVIPFAYRNIMTYYGPVLKTRYWFQMLYADLDNLKSVLPELAEGRYPLQTYKEAVVGYQAARQWELAVGDYFIYDPVKFLFHYIDPPMDHSHLYRVVGILKHDLPFDFLSGSVLMPLPDEIEQRRQFLLPNGAFIYPTHRRLAVDDLNNEFYSNHLAPLFIRRNWTDLTTLNALIMVVFAVLLVNLLCAGWFYIDQNMKDIGLLKSFGMDNSNILFVFISGLVSFVIMGLVIGVGIANLVIYLLNMAYSKPFAYVFNYYQLPAGGYLLVIVLLILMILGCTGYVIAKINRSAPAELLVHDN